MIIKPEWSGSRMKGKGGARPPPPPPQPFFPEIVTCQGYFPGNLFLFHSPRYPEHFWPPTLQ